VAKFLGLDEDDLVAEYAFATKDRLDAGVVPDPPVKSDRNWIPLIVAVALLAAIIAGGWLVVRRYGPSIWAHLYKSHSSTAVPAAPFASAKDADDPPSEAASGMLELSVEAGKDAEIKVDVDGVQQFQGHISAGKTKKFQARDHFDVTSSDSSALLLELNGQTVPPIGAPGEPGSTSLSRKDLNPKAGDRN
jgi:hypothetical protein